MVSIREPYYEISLSFKALKGKIIFIQREIDQQRLINVRGFI
jgi:hypothetical protein